MEAYIAKMIVVLFLGIATAEYFTSWGATFDADDFITSFKSPYVGQAVLGIIGMAAFGLTLAYWKADFPKEQPTPEPPPVVSYDSAPEDIPIPKNPDQ